MQVQPDKARTTTSKPGLTLHVINDSKIMFAYTLPVWVFGMHYFVHHFNSWC